MLSRFKNFLHNLRHSDEMVDQPTPVFPSVPEHITAYFQKLNTINDLHGTDRLKAFVVLELDFFKHVAPTHGQHEYSSAHVPDPDSAMKINHLAFERTPGENNDIDRASISSDTPKPEASTMGYANLTHSNPDLRKSGTARIASTSRSSLSSLPTLSPTSSSTSSSPKQFADDRVTPLPSARWQPTDKLLSTLVFRAEKPLYLHDLVMLAEEIHKVNPSYLLLSNNCYHFVGILAIILVGVYEPKVVYPPRSKERGGKFCGIEIFNSDQMQTSIASIRRNFEKRVTDFVSLLCVECILASTYTSYAIAEIGRKSED